MTAPPLIGIDIGSVSLNVAVLDADGTFLEGSYERTSGQPMPRLLEALRQLRDTVSQAALCGTGSGRPLLADLLGLPVENEIVAHAWGAVHYHPEVRSIIEIGGQDSKLILLDGRAADGSPLINDQAMNEICAAGTGSFLDQQAARLDVDINGEFGTMALRSERPAAVAGRCSVFAKSDMIHLQQEGYPKEDIIAGLCYALARNYLSNLARGRRLRTPVLFQGGVAANRGVVRAFEDLLELGSGGLVIPEHFGLVGAIGAALVARNRQIEPMELDALIERLGERLERPTAKASPMPRLERREAAPVAEVLPAAPHETLFVGIDVGSVSTNVVLLDRQGAVHGEIYLYTQGDPITAVRTGLMSVGEAAGFPPVAAVGVTGSGRYLIGDFVGADLVVNEITAQARAATEIDPEADTVFEIGGQDSKFIRLRDGAVIDFEMNKVCAAGTGAFLAEQATRLGINIERDFSRLAFEAEAPVDLGSRCTVFMESDLIHHQQQGTPKGNLVAGLAYAIARNYLEKVVGHRSIGDRILFQGGVAANASVVVAFENVLGKPIVVPPHNCTTGAIGAALLARDEGVAATAFRGFDLSHRSYTTESFQCKGCPNRCEIKKVLLDGETSSFYGSICGKFDVRTDPLVEPDLFAEREQMLLDGWLPDGPAPGAPAIGIPRVLLFHEFFPEWCAFFQALGYRVVLSEATNRHILNECHEHVVAETCLPVKAAYGHVADLVAKGIHRVFLPAVIEAPQVDGDSKQYTCVYVQGISTFIRSAFPTLDVLRPTIHSAGRRTNWHQAMRKLGRDLGHSPRSTDAALSAARTAQQRFHARCTGRGREVLATAPPSMPLVALFGRSYNACDKVLSLQVARKLRQRGALPIPLDFLPLDGIELEEAWDDMVWKAGRTFIAAAQLVRSDPRFHPLLISSFGCGPDGFLLSILEEQFRDQPFLVLELDEHFADAGVITRCEAFLHEVRTHRAEQRELAPAPARSVAVPGRRHLRGRTVYIPHPSPHALAVKVALEAIGLETRMLPAPDRETEELGREATMSRGCIPLIFFAGDAVRMTQEPDFDPQRSAFACAASDEPCKISQFPRSIRSILDRRGAEAVELIAPRLSMEHADSFYALGPRFERVMWRALVAIDLFEQKLYITRPYEAEPGRAEAVFEDHVGRVADAAGGSDAFATLAEALDALDAVPRRPDAEPLPRIGLIGEHYAQTNPYVNNDLVRAIEGLGGEVWASPYFTDYLRLQGRDYPRLLARMGKPLASAIGRVRGIVQRRDYGRIEDILRPHLRGVAEPPIPDLFALAASYLDPDMLPHVVIGTGKAVDFARRGFAGLVNVLPLACLTATAVAGHFPMLRADHNGLPILTLTYDCLQSTNQSTRLQAFMHQVHSRSA